MIGKKIANLIGVRTIVTLSITGALIYGFVFGKVNNEQFMTIATMIFTFYFAKEQQKEEEINKEGEIMSKTNLENIEITGETAPEEDGRDKNV